MIHVISTSDGSIRFTVDAADINEACEALGRDLGYDSYAAMCADLGYVGSNFSVVRVMVEEPQEKDVVGRARAARLKMITASAINAFKFGRR